MDENQWNTKFSGEPHKPIPIPARCRTRAPDRVLHDFIFWGCGCVSARASPCSAFMRLIDWRVAGFLGGEVPHFWGLFQANSGTQNGIKIWAQVVSGGVVSSIVRHRILNHKVKTEVKALWVPDFLGGFRWGPDWQAIPLWLISDKALGGLGLSEALLWAIAAMCYFQRGDHSRREIWKWDEIYLKRSWGYFLNHDGMQERIQNNPTPKDPKRG